MEKIRLADLEFSYKDALKALTELAEQIRATKAEISGLEKENEILRNAGRADTEQYKNNAKAVETNKVALAGLQKEYKDTQTVVTSSIAAKDEEIGTIRKLEARNKELRTSLRNLNLETEAGRKQQKTYIAEINKNTETIRTNSDAYVQQKMNIGNYKSALDVLPGSMKNVANGFQMAGNAAKAFIANPVVLAITAIIAVVGGLFKAFKNTEEGGDRLKKKFDQIKAVVDVLKDRIENFALGLAKVFSGEQKLKDLKGTFAGIGDEIKRDVKLAGELADMMRKLEDAEIDMLVTSERRNTLIKQLLEASSDQNLEEEKRISLLQQAQGLIDKETTAQKDLLLMKFANEIGTTDLAAAQERLNKAAREGKQITLEEIGLGNSVRADRQRVNEIIRDYIKLEGDAASRKKETTSQISGMQKKLREDEEKAAAKRVEELNKIKKAEKEAMEPLRELASENKDIWEEVLKDYLKATVTYDKEAQELIKSIQQGSLDGIKQWAAEEIAAAQAIYDYKVSLANGAFNIATTLYDRQTAKLTQQKNKELKIAGDDANRRAAIEEEYNAKVAKIKRKAAILDKIQTLFNIALDTAAGVTNAAAKTVTMPLIPWIIANGITQAAIVAATPLPDDGGGGVSGGRGGASVPGIAGSGNNGNASPQVGVVNNLSAAQPVLVLEEFQFVQGTQVKVKSAGEL